MVRNGSRSSQRSLEEVQSQFQAWRQQRTKGEKIPETLWQTATSLHPHYSINQISRTLRLDYMDLKERVGAVEKRKSKGRNEAQFIELPFTGSAVDTAECMVKLRDPRGARIHIKVKGTGVGPLLEAIQGLLNGKI